MKSRILRAEDFPQLREEDNVRQQIKTLYDYVFKLREQLQYLLGNLSRENWNEEDLNMMISSFATDADVQELTQKIDTLSEQIGSSGEEEST